MNKKKLNKNDIINIILLVALFCITTVITDNFIMLRIGCGDYTAHIESALNGEGYSLMSVLIKGVIQIFKNRRAVSILIGAIAMLTVISVSYAVKQILRLLDINKDYREIIPFAFTTIFLCKLCVPNWSDNYYIGSYITQPWHNSTYMLMRLFGYALLGVFFYIDDHYLKKLEVKELILFTALLSITNYSKPNFILAFAPMMLLSLVYDFIKSKAKGFRKCFVFGTCVLISLFVLVYQYNCCFASNSGEGIAFSFQNMISTLFIDRKFLIHFVLCFSFPLYVTFLLIKNKINNAKLKRIYAQTWIMYIISFLEYLLLIETGNRFDDGNFGWGGLFFSNFLFVISCCVLYKIKEENHINDREYSIGKCIYTLYFLEGICYSMLLLFCQSGYYI